MNSAMMCVRCGGNPVSPGQDPRHYRLCDSCAVVALARHDDHEARDFYVLERRKQGATYQQIAWETLLSRERCRQIVIGGQRTARP